ncbi:hypothetical protein BASA60_001973 [Batrachochytrium salamandrivorans]|nr:hypothetical protein BASA60_001973 [Batrachochytrium salamandrivorans]
MSSQSKAVGAERLRPSQPTIHTGNPTPKDLGCIGNLDSTYSFRANMRDSPTDEQRVNHTHHPLLLLDTAELPRSNVKVTDYVTTVPMNNSLISSYAGLLHDMGSVQSPPETNPGHGHKAEQRHHAWSSAYSTQISTLQQRKQQRPTIPAFMDANSRPNWAQSLGSPTELSQLSADDMDGATPRFESIHQQIDHIFPTATIAHSHGHNQSHPRRKQQHLPHAWEIHDLPQRPNIYSQQQRVAVEMPLPLSPRGQALSEHYLTGSATPYEDSTPLVESSSAATLVVSTLNPSESGEVEGKTEPQLKISSLELLFTSRLSIPFNAHFSVLKIVNINWDLTTQDVLVFFGEPQIPIYHRAPHYHHSIHIIMDRTTGKTLGECFVEFPTQSMASQALRTHRRGFLKGRPVSVEPSTQDELYHALFPNLKASLEQSEERISQPLYEKVSDPLVQTALSDTSTSISPDQECRPELVYMAREDIFTLLSSCKPSRTHPSRKCPRRPFENIISILAKVPWHRANLIPILQRDHLFEMAKLGTESLLFQVQRVNSTIDIKFLEQFHLKCPPELERYVYMPIEQDDPSLITSSTLLATAPPVQDRPPVAAFQFQSLISRGNSLGNIPTPDLGLKHRSESLNDLQARTSSLSLENAPLLRQSFHRCISSARSSPAPSDIGLQGTQLTGSALVPSPSSSSSSPAVSKQSTSLDHMQHGSMTNLSDRHQGTYKQYSGHTQFGNINVDALRSIIMGLEQDLLTLRQKYDTVVAEYTQELTETKKVHQHLMDHNKRLEYMCEIMLRRCSEYEGQQSGGCFRTPIIGVSSDLETPPSTMDSSLSNPLSFARESLYGNGYVQGHS